MKITLKSGKDLQEEPLKVSKEVDAEGITPHVFEKVVELEVKKTLPLPFPQRQIEMKIDVMFKIFFDTFRELHINLPLLDALQGMPKYAKYLRDVVANKVKL